MADRDLHLDFGRVKAQAEDIRTHDTRLTAYLTAIRQTIMALDAVWTSEASTTIRTKIDKMQAKFEQYSADLRQYAQFLDDTVEMYTTTEKTLSTNASQFD